MTQQTFQLQAFWFEKGGKPFAVKTGNPHMIGMVMSQYWVMWNIGTWPILVKKTSHHPTTQGIFHLQQIFVLVMFKSPVRWGTPRFSTGKIFFSFPDGHQDGARWDMKPFFCVLTITFRRGWDWCPVFGDFKHHQTKYLLELMSPRVFGDVELGHWPTCFGVPGFSLFRQKLNLIMSVSGKDRSCQRSWIEWFLRPSLTDS